MLASLALTAAPGGDHGLDLTPPPRANTVVNAPAGTTVVNDTFYLDPLGSLQIPNLTQRVTILGAKTIPTQARGWRDVHIEGYPDAPFSAGPRTDGRDLLQIKRGSELGVIPERLTFRYGYGHDVTRPPGSGEHPDGVQLMCGRHIVFADWFMERVSVQPFFARDGGQDAWGGPIEDITYLRCGARGQAEGFNNFRISGDDELVDPDGDPAGPVKSGRYVPTRVRVLDCYGDKGPSMDSACVVRGGQVVNFTED